MSELFKDYFKFHLSLLQIKQNGIIGMSNILSLYLILNCAIVLLANNVIISIMNLICSILVWTYYIYKNNKMRKLINEESKKAREILLKNIIRRKGLVFVKELKNELYRNRLQKRKK